MIKIEVTNPYHQTVYETNDIDKKRWLIFLKNHSNGNEEVISFMDCKINKHITINPSCFASIEVDFMEDK